MHPTRSSPPPSVPAVRVVFLDAEGTLWVPRPGRTFDDFWVDPTPARAVQVFDLAPGCLATLEALRASGVRLVVVSRHDDSILPALLDRFRLTAHFEDVLINGDKGERIRDWLHEAQVPQAAAVMVGDRIDLDVRPAERVGVRALLVDAPYNRDGEAERISGLDALPEHLGIRAPVAAR